MEGVNFNSASILEKDKSVTYNKLDDNLRYDIDSSRFVDNIHFGGCPLLMNYESRFISQQGMTTIDNRYVVTCIYVDKDDQGQTIDSSRMLVVYDIVDKVEKGHQIFTEAQLGHVNSISYYDGYIYVTTLNSNNKIAKLKWNPSTFTFSDLSYINPTITVESLSVHEGKYIVTTSSGSKILCFYSLDLAEFEKIIEYEIPRVAIQGSHFDGEYIYVCNSSSILGTSSISSYSLPLLTEQIYVFDMEGNVYRSFSFSRGKYGEIQDCSTIEVSGTKFILVSTNLIKNTACIEVSALLASSNIREAFDVLPSDLGRTDPYTLFYMFLDGSSSDKLFVRGTNNRPFTSVNQALIIITRLNLVSKLYISNLTDDTTIYLQDVPVMLHFHFAQNVSLNNLYIVGCPHVILDADSNTSCILHGVFSMENTTVSGRTLPALQTTGSNLPQIQLMRSYLTGYSQLIDDTQPNFRFNDSICNLHFPTTWVAPSNMNSLCSTSLVKVNGKIYGASIDAN